MGGRVSRGVAALLCGVSIAACGPGRLPDDGFGSVGGDAETFASDASDEGDSPTSADTDDSSTSPSTVGDELSGDGDEPTDEGPSTGDGDSGDGDSGDGDGDSGDGDSGDGDSGDGDGDPDTGEADEITTDDTWGLPPDVTNEPCEPLTQDCYPTHKCVPFATQPNSAFLDANKCMPILGDRQWGESCTLSSFHEGQDDCDADGYCWNLDWVGGQLQGTCVPFCLGSPQDLECPLGWGCLFSGAVSLCTMVCDPFAQDCPDPYGCYWGGNNFQCLLTATLVGANQSCDQPNECTPGLACVDKALVPDCFGPDDNCCTPWCDISAPDCVGSLGCVAMFDPDQELPPGFVDVGVCVE